MSGPHPPRKVNGSVDGSASAAPAWDDPYPTGPYSTVSFPQGAYSPAPTHMAPPAGAGDTRPLPAQRTPRLPHAGTVTDPVIAQFGDIQVTATSVRTPIGSAALRGSHWHVSDHWVASQKTPGWAIALAVVGFFCLTIVSLLFLLAKETTHTRVVRVTVSSGQLRHETQVLLTEAGQAQQVYNMVDYVRSLAAA